MKIKNFNWSKVDSKIHFYDELRESLIEEGLQTAPSRDGFVQLSIGSPGKLFWSMKPEVAIRIALDMITVARIIQIEIKKVE